MKNRFDLIIFDWDGTLIDSIEWITRCMQQAAETWQCDIPSDHAAREVIGLSLARAMDELFPDVDLFTRKRLIESYSKHFFSKTITRNDFFPGVYEMLVKLNQAGFLLAVATGKSRAGLDRALKHTETEELFTCTRCADETASKPEPKMLIEIIEQLEIPPARTLMIGDSVHDLQMAENAGITSVAVACGVHTHERLQEYNPLISLEQTAELLTLI
jgi:phosphoglycolate phosphatase